MAAESLNRRPEIPAETVAEDDYRSFCEALSSSARGRAFLDEFARRNRHADTEVVLAALHRIEASALNHASPEADRIRQDLRALLDTLRTARPQTENSPTAIKAATLAALIDFAQARIEAIVTMPAANESETLAAVPALEQPELPIPHPAAAATPMMALVQAAIRPESPGAAPQSYAPHARRKSATVIPIVEFDYRAHQSGRPASLWSAPEEAWTTLAPPAISSPIFAAPATPQPVPFIAEPDSVPAPAVEVEPYELWLDPPPVARAEPETLADIATQAEPLSADLASMTEAAALNLATALESAIEPMLERAVTEVLTSELAVADVAATETTSAAQAAADTEVTATLTVSTMETLMEQMEQAAAPAPMVKGHAEADPLAPLMALSEEERIALFT